MTGKRTLLRTVALWALLLGVTVGLRAGVAIHFPNVFHPDEIFQTLEPAHRIAFGYGASTWEWRGGVRSWVFPTFLAGVMRTTVWMGPGSAGYLDGIIVVMSLGAMATVWFAYAWARRVSSPEAAIIAAGACATFFGLVYFSSKALTEVAATNFLLPGLYLGIYGDQATEKRRLFFAGILVGLAGSLRIQIIPAVGFAALYFCYPRWRQRIPAVAAGLALPVLAFGLVDKLTLTYPWQSFIRYFQVNVSEGRSLDYGVMPWYWYLELMVLLLGPVLLFIWQGARRSPFLAAVIVIIVGSHSLLSHKEIRFMYPMLAPAIVLGAIGFVESAKRLRARFTLLASPTALVAAGLAFFVLSSALMAATSVRWLKPQGAQLAFQQLSRDPALCGVGFTGVTWWKTGGYSSLHRDVPIVAVSDEADIAKQAPTFNALVAPSATPGIPSSYAESGCSNGVCLYRRPGGCETPQPEDTLDWYLRKTGK